MGVVIFVAIALLLDDLERAAEAILLRGVAEARRALQIGGGRRVARHLGLIDTNDGRKYPRHVSQSRSLERGC